MNLSTLTEWISPVDTCDVCKTPIKDEFIDGRVDGLSTWALFCPECHKQHGVGLGTGKGQHYKRSSQNGHTGFFKIAG